MQFAKADLRSRLHDELAKAARADIAVAFFSPEPATLAALQAVPELRLLVSNSFQVNNPDALEALHRNNHWVRALPPEGYGGNLHAKVYLMSRKDKSTWAMVGSANLTRSGLTSNQEACVVLDSNVPADAATLQQIRDWVDGLFDQNLPEIDFDLARAVFESQHHHHSRPGVATVTGGHWALKPGELGEFWHNWLAERVVSIGWRQLPDTAAMTRTRADAAYRTARPDDTAGQVNTNVPQILRFTQSMQTGDRVLICGRYDAVGAVDRDVYLYGVARTLEVNGTGYYFDSDSDWHRCKRHARIQPIEESLPRSLVAEALQRGSFVPTIMQLDQLQFTALEEMLRTELGVVVDV